MDRADEELKINMNLLEQWIDDITNYQQLSVKTRGTYITDVRNAARIFAKNRIAFTAIRKEHLKIFLSTIKKETKRLEGLSHGRLKGIFSALNSMMEFLLYEEKTLHNPVPPFRKRYMKTYKNNTRTSNRRQVPSTEELGLMIAGIRDHQKKSLHMILAKTGILKPSLRIISIASVPS